MDLPSIFTRPCVRAVTRPHVRGGATGVRGVGAGRQGRMRRRDRPRRCGAPGTETLLLVRETPYPTLLVPNPTKRPHALTPTRTHVTHVSDSASVEGVAGRHGARVFGRLRRVSQLLHACLHARLPALVVDRAVTDLDVDVTILHGLP